jgi:hypothetical protein
MLGILNVTVLSAENLKNTFFDRADPYITVGTQYLTLQTFVADLAWKESRAIWNERLVFNIESLDKLPSNLHVTLVDKRHYLEGQFKDNIILEKDVSISVNGEKESLDVITITHEKVEINLIVHFVPFTIMQRIYEKLDDAMENFKKKMVAQIVDKLASFIP